MFEPEDRPSHQQQWQLIGTLLLILLATLAAITLGYLPSWGDEPGPAAAGTPRTDPEAMLARLQGVLAPRPTPTSSATRVPIQVAPGAGAPARPTPSYQDHYWLERPIGPENEDAIAPWYVYASRGDGSYPIHHGVELVNAIGTPVLAAGDGTIVVAGSDAERVVGARAGYYGNVVVEQLDATFAGQPVYVVYAHVYEVLVQEGQRVATGETIATVGEEGAAEGPHVHVEVRLGRNDYAATVNPALWLKPLPGRGTLAGALLTADGTRIPDTRLVLYQPGNSAATLRELYSYPELQVNPDPAWGENLALGDLLPGEYVVEGFVRGLQVQRTVTITAGRTTWLDIRLPR